MMMKRTLAFFIMTFLCLPAAAQTPRELWNQIPTAADTTAVCRTDTAKVNRYMKSLDATIKKIDGIIEAKKAAMKSKESAAQAEVAAQLKNRPDAKISEAEAQRLNNMSESQKKAYANEKVKEMTGMSVGDLQAAAKKMENASEEEQMALAMQMMGSLNLSGMSEVQPVDDNKIKILELQSELPRVGNEYMAQVKSLDATFPESQYLEQVFKARDDAQKKYVYPDGPDGDFESPEMLALHYRNFLNFFCPAVSPISLRYMNRNVALLDIELKSAEQTEAILREIASIEPTEINKMAIENQLIGSYSIVRKYAVELKRRYEAFCKLSTIYRTSERQDMPINSPLFEGSYHGNFTY